MKTTSYMLGKAEGCPDVIEMNRVELAGWREKVCYFVDKYHLHVRAPVTAMVGIYFMAEMRLYLISTQHEMEEKMTC